MAIKITLRNPLDHSDLIQYSIVPNNTELAHDWQQALKELLAQGHMLEKNFCFLGFPKTARTVDYICKELNECVYDINSMDWQSVGLVPYVIEEWFSPDVVRFGLEYPCELSDTSLGLSVKHEVMNKLHNHFERLQGTVWAPGDYYKLATPTVKYAIRQLNTLCHEIESLVLSQRKAHRLPEWVRPSQITTFIGAQRHDLKDQHRLDFVTNGYDRKFGHVYMHWAQIGKTLFEVFRDEHAPVLTDTVCEAITQLKYYSGEFDVEWGQDVVRNGNFPWHVEEQDRFETWLIQNNMDPQDPALSLGYLPLGQVTLQESFGTTNIGTIWEILSTHLDIYSIEVDGVTQTYDYCWSDSNYKQSQIARLL